MRLREMQQILTTNIPLLAAKTEGTNIGPNMIRLSPLLQLRASLKQLAEVPAIAQRARNILSTPLIGESFEDSVVIHVQNWQPVNVELEQLKQQSSLLLTSLNAVLPPEHQLAIAIQLPPVKSIHDLKDVLDDIDRILATLASNKHELPKFSNFDTGSAYIEFVPPNAQLLSFILGVVAASAYLVRTIFKLATEAKEYEALGMATEDIDAAMKAKKKMYELMVQQAAKALAKEHQYCSDGDHEQLGKLVMVIECLNNNISRGMRFLPSSSHKEQSKLAAAFDELKKLPTGPLPKLLGAPSDDDKSDKNGGSSGT